MILSSCLSLSLALSAQAFLIPGEVDAFSKDGLSNNPPAPVSQQSEKDLTLDCSSCPYALNSERHGGHEWTNDVESDLHLKIDSDGESLRLNGVSFYPIQGVIPPQLHVSQSKKDGEDPTFEAYQGDLRLSYSLEYSEKKADDGNSLVTVVMSLMALDGQMIRIDDVEIKTIKKADGKVG